MRCPFHKSTLFVFVYSLFAMVIMYNLTTIYNPQERYVPVVVLRRESSPKTSKTDLHSKSQNGIVIQKGTNPQSKFSGGKPTEGKPKDASHATVVLDPTMKAVHNSDEHIVAGNPRHSQALLVIGLPTVKRKNATYLQTTLKTLVEGLEHFEKKHVIIVVFVTDFDQSSVNGVANQVRQKFNNELETGLIRVINASRSFYPDFKNLPRLWGDKADRVRWRSKQSLDYAFLFKYCKDLGQYYLQLEDDVLARKGYFKKINSSIHNLRHRQWSMLEFSGRGFIGKMYRTSDLNTLSKFVQKFYWVWPIDFLNHQFNDIFLYGNPSWALLYRPPLFLHVGKFSSLDGQIRRLEDMEGLISKRIHDSDNPDAIVNTSIQQINEHLNIQSTYDTEYHKAFWGKNIKKGDNIIIKFDKSVKILKIIVESGGNVAKEDYFGAAKIFFSTKNKNNICEKYILWKKFENMPQLMVQSQQGIVCDCVMVEVTGLRNDTNGMIRWLLVQEIAVWTVK